MQLTESSLQEELALLQRVICPIEPVNGYLYHIGLLAQPPVAAPFLSPVLFSLPHDLPPMGSDLSPLVDMQQQITTQAGADWERVLFPLPKNMPDYMTRGEIGANLYAHYKALRSDYDPFRDDFYARILESRASSNSKSSSLRSLLNRSSLTASNPHRNTDGSIRSLYPFCICARVVLIFFSLDTSQSSIQKFLVDSRRSAYESLERSSPSRTKVMMSTHQIPICYPNTPFHT